MESTAEPKLAAPGAGLPRLELLIGRVLFRLNCLTGNRDRFNRRIAAEREAIRALLAPLTADQAGRRVLIERVRGLEDSSRYWSVWMVLEHLRIVHVGLTPVVESLGRTIKPPGQASTAAVKPAATVTAAVVSGYEDSCERVLAAIAAVKDTRTQARFTHPWFGSLDVHGWHALIGGHLAIHRRQIERIIAAQASGVSAN